MIVVASKIKNSAKQYLPYITACCLLVLMLVIACKFTFFALADENIVIAPDKQQILNEARQAFTDRDTTKAVRLYSSFLQSYPNHQESLRALGELQVRLGKYKEADTTYSRLLLVDQEDAAVMAQLGSVKFYQKKKYEAQALLSSALASPRLNEEQRAQASKILREIYGDWNILHEMQKKEDFAGQERFLAYHKDTSPEAIRENIQLLENKKEKPSWDEIRTRVRAYEEGKDREGLIDYVSSLMQYESTRHYALLKRAYLRIYSNDFTGAESDLDTALRHSASDKARQDVENARERLAKRMAEYEKREAAQTARKPRAGTGKARTARFNPYVTFKRVNQYLQNGEYQKAEQILGTLRLRSLRRPEQGIYTFYKAELAFHADKKDKALAGYNKAARQVTNVFWLTSVNMRLAQIYADRQDAENATRHVERAVALSPDQAWRMQQAARIYLNLQMPEKAAEYYRRSLELDPSPLGAAGAYRGLADLYKRFQDMTRYLEYATRYVYEISNLSDPLESHHESTKEYFRGELRKAAGHAEEAIPNYQRAASLTTEKYRLSEIHHKLAECYADMGDYEQAAIYAEKSAEILPDQSWPVHRSARLFRRIGQLDRAIDYSRRALDLDPSAPASSYQSLALLYLRYGDRESFSQFNKQYIDLLTQEIEALGDQAPDELLQRLYDARWMQTRGTKVWGFNSYHYGFRDANQNYYYGMTNELYRNFKLPNGWSGKAYLHIKGTPTAYYDGNYYNEYSGRTGKWRSRRHLDESLHGIVGVRVRPFFFIPHLSIGPEELFPLGHHHMDPDFRLRAGYFRSIGKTPRLFGNSWTYASAYGDAIYSTRDNDFLMYGHLRYGRTFVHDYNRNFLVIPHAGVNWSYSGQDASKGKRWGLKGGPGLLFSYWLDEDKYHAPQRTIDMGIYYHWSMSHDGENAVGFNVSLSF